MVFKCCVPMCKGNYDSNHQIACFSFPKEEEMIAKWMHAIPRKNFSLTKYTKVCAIHFKEEDIIRKVEAYKENGEKITVNLERIRLRKGAVPVIFPKCPSYLSQSKPSRESRDEKRISLENRQLEAAIKKSQKDEQASVVKNRFTNLQELLLLLKSLNRMWKVMKEDDQVLIAQILYNPAPTIPISVTVNNNLDLNCYVHGVCLNSIINYTLPLKVSCFKTVEEILTTLADVFSNQPTSLSQKPISDCAVSLLNSLKKENLDNFNFKISFIIEQIELLSQQKNHYVYSVEFIILCSIIFNISPHAYRYMRSIKIFTMPHPNTLKNLCLKYNTNPLLEINDNFLQYTKDKAKSLQNKDKIVNLMIDEIHLKQYFDFKGGNVVGSAHDSVQAAKTAYVFMVQSLLSSYKDVVHILPVKKIVAQTLHEYIKKITIGLHQLGFNVICISSDNNSINRKAMSYFANPPKLEIAYPHPAKANAPLFLCEIILCTKSLLQSSEQNNGTEAIINLKY